MPQLQQNREFYPTKLQREKTLDMDSGLLELLNRSRDSDWFVARDIETWARSLHLWQPECSDATKRESFVRERINGFLRLGILYRAEQVFEDGSRVAGFLILARRSETKVSPKWSPKDAAFLKACGIAPREDTHEPLGSRHAIAETKNDRHEQVAMNNRMEPARQSFGDDSEAVTVGK